MADLSWPGTTRRSRRNADSVRVEMAIPDEAHALFFVATYKVGLPAGQFAIAPSANLRGGTLWRVLRAAGAYSSDSVWLVNLQITVLPEVAPNNEWLIPDAAGIARTCDFLTQVAPGILKSFLDDWPQARAFTQEHPEQVRFPAAVLAALDQLIVDSSFSGVQAAVAAVAEVVKRS